MTEQRPDESIHRIDDAPATPARSTLDLIKEGAMVLPAILDLLRKLMTDPAVPRRRKVFALLAVGYMLSPIDLVPDFIPVLGRFDDVIFAAYAVDRLLHAVPPEIREAYWMGSPDTLELISGLVAWGAEMVPAPVRRLLGS